jgi:hypothetical protein
MKNISLAVATLLAVSSSSLFAEEDKNDWKISGNSRTAVTSQTVESDDPTTDFATGGWVTLQSPVINNFQVTASLFTSQTLLGANEDGWLNNGEGKSYTYFGEAYVAGQLFSKDSIIGKTDIILGRKIIETPFANSDDMGMSPDSFEVALVQASPIENLTILGGRVTKIAGYDGDSVSKFDDITYGDGISVVAGIYSDEDAGFSAQAWQYKLDDADGTGLNMSLYYADATYSMNMDEDFSLTLGAEYAMFLESNQAERDGSLIGGKVEASIADLSLGFAMDTASGDIAPQGGLSCAPYYTTSNIYLAISSPEAIDITAISGKADYQVTEELSVSALYLTMSSDEMDDDWNEIDLGASYSVSDDLAIDLYMATWNEGDTDFTRYGAFANYSF